MFDFLAFFERANARAPHGCDPFFTTKQVGKGTGLGLSMVAECSAPGG